MTSSDIFIGLTLISLAAVLAVMVTGIVSMSKGGEFNEKYGNKLMRYRVYLQGLTVFFFAMAMVTQG